MPSKPLNLSKTGRQVRRHDGLGERTRKTSENVALDIVRDIVWRQLEAGDRLPLENEMLALYKVSRSSLREALRLLEVQGLIVIRPGPGGGPTVGEAHPRTLARTMTLYLHMQNATYDELLTAWCVTDPALAELAAGNEDREAVEKALLPFVDPTADTDMPRMGDLFHDTVADLADNRVLALSHQSVGYIVESHLLEVVSNIDIEDDVAREHRQIAKAIMAGNKKKARKLMEEHVTHVGNHFREYWPTKVGENIELR